MTKYIIAAAKIGLLAFVLIVAAPALAQLTDSSIVPTGLTPFNCASHPEVPGCYTPLNVSAYRQIKGGDIVLSKGVFQGQGLKLNWPSVPTASSTAEFLNYDYGATNWGGIGGYGNGGAWWRAQNFTFWTPSKGITSATAKMVSINDSGYLGVGTTSARTPLEVKGKVRSSGTGADFCIDSNYDGVDERCLSTTGNGTTPIDLRADTTAGRTGIVVTPSPITNTGVIGVDQTVIQKRVRGSCAATGDAIQTIKTDGTVDCIDLSTLSGANYWTLSGAFLINNVGSSVVLKNNTGSKMFLQLAGQTGAVAEVSGENGKLTLGSNVAQPIVFTTNYGTERMRISDTGYVGIGDATPSYPLDVAGTVQATGFRLPTGAAVNYVLTSDSSGNATWKAAANNGISGTANYLSMFNAAGTGLVNAPLRVWYTSSTGAKYLMTDSRLDVNGALHAVNVTISGGAPADGKVLTAINSSGDATWESVPAPTTKTWFAGEHCGLYISGTVASGKVAANGKVNCVANGVSYDPSVSCPSGFTQLGGDFSNSNDNISPDRFMYTCVKN